jgi:hypothetical protein
VTSVLQAQLLEGELDDLGWGGDGLAAKRRGLELDHLHALVANIHDVAPSHEPQFFMRDVHGSTPSGPVVGSRVHTLVISHSLLYRETGHVFSDGFQPRAARTEHRVGNQTDRNRLGHGNTLTSPVSS